MRKHRILSLVLAISMAISTSLPAMAATQPGHVSGSAASSTVLLEESADDGFAGLAEAASNAEVQDIELTAKDSKTEATILEGMLNGETEITVSTSQSKAENAAEAAIADTNLTDEVSAEVVTENGETTVVLDVDPRTEGIIEFMNEGSIMSGGSDNTITLQSDDGEGEDSTESEDPEKNIDPITNQEESGFAGITVEEKAGILAAYQDFVNFKVEYADLFGVDVPYNTYKDSDNNPLISTLSLTYIYYDPTIYDVEVDGQSTKVGGFYRLNMLGGGAGGDYVKVTLEDGSEQERSYMNGQSIIFMLKTFDASNRIGAQMFGEEIAKDAQACMTEIAKAEQAASSQGATMTDAEKYLIINDYISTHARLDMDYMMGSQGLKAKETATDPYHDTIHGALSQNDDYNSLPDSQKEYMIEGVENMWKTNQIGSLGMGQGLCISYVNAFSYLVQCMRSDIYKDSDGKWKNYKEVNYVQNADGAYEQSYEAGYVVDVVDSVLNAFASTFGEGQYATSDHYWNTVLANDKWYSVDTNYTDAYISSMLQSRGEVDGSLNHLLFMFAENDLINLFGEDHFVSIDSMYSDLATDDSLSHTWFSYVNGPVSIGDDGYYYAYDSTDTFEQLNNSSSMMGNQEAEAAEYKICKRSYGLADNSKDMTELIAFAASDSSNEGAGTTVYNPSTNKMEKNDELTALYDQMLQEMEIYPAIAITGSLYEGKFYFNISNCIMSYDIETGAVEKVKEYNTASATRDWTRPLGCDAFTITDDVSKADITVENHPLTSLAIIDGQMHTAVATNYALISTPGWRYFPDIMGATGISGYGYEFEETNYNADYVNYDTAADRIPAEYEQYKDMILQQLKQRQEPNDNSEFMYTASIHDHTISMNTLTGSHEYETVSVAATCGHNAYTEERCKDCGAIKEGSRKEEEGTALDHHFVEFEETYYRTTDDSPIQSPKIGESLEKPDQVIYRTGTSYVCVRCLTATEEAPEVYDTHTYSPETVEWTETDAPNGKKSYSGYTASISKLVGDAGCAERVGKLDAYMSDDALEITLDEEVKAEAELTYEGDCTEGATAIYTAVFETENGTFTETKEDKLDPGTHHYDAEFTWIPTKNDNDVITGMESATAVMTCRACGEVSEPQACELKSENINAGAHTAGGIKYTASVEYEGYTYEDENTESLVQYSLADVEVKTGDLELVYNGKNQIPEIQSVIVAAEDPENPQTLEKDVDYTIESSDNGKDVGSYEVTIKGTGDKFIGEYKVAYTIVAKDIGAANVSLQNSSLTYTGSEVTPVIESVKVDDETLDEADYNITTVSSVDIGEYKMTVEGQGNYSGKVEVAYSIVAADFKNATVDAELQLTYTGKVNTPEIKSVKVGDTVLVEGTDYIIADVPNSVEIGDYKMIIEGQGNYSGKVEVSYSIIAADFKNAIVNANVKLSYTGKVNTPKIKSVTIDGNTLIEGTDYVISNVPKSIDVGKYQMVIKGQGKYTGTHTIEYTINQIGNKVTAKSVAKTYNTKKQSFSIGAKANGGAKLSYKSSSPKVTVSSSGKVTIASKFIGKANITITAAQTKNYKAAKATITVTVNPTKTSLSSATNSGKGKVTIKWKKNSVGSGYQIQVTTDKSFKKSVKTYSVTKKTTVSKSISKLKKGKTYYVRIRTMKNISNKKYYSGWSKVRSLKIKK